jgi:hypothetical protein
VRLQFKFTIQALPPLFTQSRAQQINPVPHFVLIFSHADSNQKSLRDRKIKGVEVPEAHFPVIFAGPTAWGPIGFCRVEADAAIVEKQTDQIYTDRSIQLLSATGKSNLDRIRHARPVERLVLQPETVRPHVGVVVQ